MHAHARGTQAALSAAAGLAAMTYGTDWLGVRWAYDVSVNGAHFTLPAGFPLGLLVAALMAVAAGMAAQGRRSLGTSALLLGGGAIFASALWLLLVWAPGGAPAGQRELLNDASRLGFALLALGLPLALPPGVHGSMRGACFALGLLLAPVLLFPTHVAAAGLTDVEGTLPMLLFFLQALLALTGTAGSGRGWGRRRRAAEPEAQWLRGWLGGKRGKAARPRLRHEGMHGALPDRPSGPQGPERPAPREARRRTGWFFQF